MKSAQLSCIIDSIIEGAAMLMRLSQGQLNLLETCPRRFQHTYLDRLSLPINLEQQESLDWGNRFHLLMQQRELGLPIDGFSNAEGTLEDQQLQQCVGALVEAAPELFQPSVKFRQSEHRRTLQFQGYLLTVIYDLIVLEDGVAQILDWKTYPRPQNPNPLAQHWQTRLYPFVLAETTDYLPEQISMTYWFVQPQQDRSPRPQCLRFNYSTALHQEIQQQLTALLDRLTGLLQRYDQGELFPQVEETANHCGYCHFVVRCQREQNKAATEVNYPPSWVQIQEVMLGAELT